MLAPKTIVITGSTGGIGTALALLYAGPGTVLGLHGRNGDKLARLAEACTARGATVETLLADITDRDAMDSLLRTFDDRHAIDLIIANAGISPPTEILDRSDVERVLQVNVVGTFNAIFPVLEPMIARGRGQIAIMGSLGARVATSSSPAYSASKAALETYGLALRDRLAAKGIAVNVISPGFVASPMSERVAGPKPLLMGAERAARIIAKGLAANRARVGFPLALALAASLLSALPQDLAALFTRGFAFRVRD